MSSSKLAQRLLRQQALSSSSIWFAPKQHLWLTCWKLSASTFNSSDTSLSSKFSSQKNGLYNWRIQWGMTEQGMDRLGDVTGLEFLIDGSETRSETVVQQGQDLLRVHWEGYEWTEADELYHTVWSTVEGTQTLVTPVTGRLVHVVASPRTSNENQQHQVVDEETVWAEMACTEDDVLQAATNWMDESTYQHWTRSLEPGKFSDPQVA